MVSEVRAHYPTGFFLAEEPVLFYIYRLWIMNLSRLSGRPKRARGGSGIILICDY